MKKLTIITINFNHAEGLKRTIESIVNQTFTDYEWIVVDGGSKDGSKELIEQYKDHFAWWCSEPDKGVYNAMNKGITHATGEYINFMNSGDIFATSTILEEIFSKPRTADILYGIMKAQNVTKERMYIGNISPEMHWHKIYYLNIGHQAEFSKRKLYKKRLFDETYKIYADWEWNVCMIAKNRCTTQFLNQVVALYEGDGFSDTNNKLAIDELYLIREKYYSCLYDDDITEFKYLTIVKKYWITRKLYFLLSRMANRYYKYFEYKKY